jgi:hypothetical protein
MNHHPKTVTTALIMIIINAAFWFIFALIVFLGWVSSISFAGIVRWVMAALALGSSVVLAGIAYFIARRNRTAFFFGVAFLALIAILSVTDEFGLLDLFSLLLNLVPLGLLLKDRAWYLQSKNNQ